VVDDDGPGLTATQREQVARRGQRLDESKPGSGARPIDRARGGEALWRRAQPRHRADRRTARRTSAAGRIARVISSPALLSSAPAFSLRSFAGGLFGRRLLPQLLAGEPRALGERLGTWPRRCSGEPPCCRRRSRSRSPIPRSPRSLPTRLAYRAMRSAISSGCSTSTVEWLITPGISTLSFGSLALPPQIFHSCSCRGFAASNE